MRQSSRLPYQGRSSISRVFRFCLLGSISIPIAWAGPLRDGIEKRRAERFRKAQEKMVAEAVARPLPEGVTVKRDLAYGDDPRQRLDAYLPVAHSDLSPIIFMVHGGAWKIGDKNMTTVFENKIKRWVTRGFVFVSVNYPMLPEANPLQQADDVVRALAYVQQHSAEFHGDPARVILMGHSAGAHLVALISVHPDLAARQGARPWLGTVSLDSAAYDVVEIMQHKHLKLYDEAFGKDEAFWKSVSPYHVLTKPVPPILAVCSSRRDDSSKQAAQFAERAKTLGSPVTVLPEDLSHQQINDKLGLPGAYTDAVEAFLRTLDPVVAGKLGPP